MTTQAPKPNILQQALNKKTGIVSKVKSYGKRVLNNIKQGQEDLEQKKISNYGTINPFK